MKPRLLVAADPKKYAWRPLKRWLTYYYVTTDFEREKGLQELLGEIPEQLTS
jgi:hypothetical protein